MGRGTIRHWIFDTTLQLLRIYDSIFQLCRIQCTIFLFSPSFHFYERYLCLYTCVSISVVYSFFISKDNTQRYWYKDIGQYSSTEHQCWWRRWLVRYRGSGNRSWSRPHQKMDTPLGSEVTISQTGYKDGPNWITSKGNVNNIER